MKKTDTLVALLISDIEKKEVLSVSTAPQRCASQQKKSYKKEKIRTHLPQGRTSSDFLHLVRPTGFERATYRVGVFRHQRIKCCVFKECSAFGENVRLF